GLTAPNGPAQQAVIRQALAASGLQPEAIDYVEAHGTGTELGDPTEMGALAGVFAKDRTQPLRVGTAKTNIGHLEGAAGVAGFIKTCLSLYHEELPPHPLLEPESDGPNGPSPHIDWTQPIEVPTERTPWPRQAGHVRRAGVSSFGFGGTNAHVILEEAPTEVATEEPVEVAGPRWVTLSARTPTALDTLASRYAGELPDAPLEAIAYAANTGRASLTERLAVQASSCEELVERLRSLPARHTHRHAAPRTQPVGWLFGGQGGCRPEMGRELYERYPVFRQAWDACDRLLEQHWPTRLATICWEEPERLSTVDTQIALVAWQLALAELWKSWLGRPAWVVGHSLGEYAAAVTAGILQQDDALRLVCRRAALLDQLTERGAMLAVMAPLEQVEPLLPEAPLPEALSIAAENGPRQTVVSGPVAAIEAFATSSHGLRTKPLATSHGFHSPLVEPVMAELTAAAEQVTYSAPQCGFLSTLTGQAIETPLPADYWARQLRQPVRFATAMAATPTTDLRLELSPTPVLRALVEGDVSPAAGWKPDEEALTAEASAAQLWTRGAVVDFRAVHPRQRLAVSLPTYPFERQRHWFKTPKKSTAVAGELVHPLLGKKLDLAGRMLCFETDLADYPWLDDHRLRGQPTLPATAYLELAWAAGHYAKPEVDWAVEDLQLLRPLRWEAGCESCRVQTLCTPEGETYQIEVLQRQADGWRVAARCRLAPAGELVETPAMPVGLEPRDVKQHYADCAQAGLDYGPAFRGVTQLAGQPGLATATLALPDHYDPTGYHLPPNLADAALQSIAAALPKQSTDAWAPKTVGGARLIRTPNTNEPVTAIAIIDSDFDSADRVSELSVRVDILGRDQSPIAQLEDLRLARLPAVKKTASSVTTSQSTVEAKEPSDAITILSKAPGDEQPALILQHVRERLAVVMDMTVEELQPTQPLDTLGLDSLMAFELRDDLEVNLGVNVPMDVFLQRMTLEELSAVIARLFEERSLSTDQAIGATDKDWIEGAL
ncbi:MAG: acyltransferase domain-containing protein, partial [Planctomycetota bacterium]